ncbi:patatin-like phospholipase family protein [Mesorhizobium sp. M0977]|uniref:patatin-like phospholipase family protein n=1 Tax=Mesorhizobium sp. M0977 TaxID=2957039 RepID=UPI0033384FB7
MADLAADKPFRVLTLDGGGAKGFYTLGVLHEVEAMLGKPLHEAFDLIFGTSTGAIIGTLLAIGTPVSKIHELYRKHVPHVMRPRDKASRSAALKNLGDEIFKKKKFDAAKTGLGVVATKWVMETPIIFKSDSKQAHGRAATFVPGFGCTLSRVLIERATLIDGTILADKNGVCHARSHARCLGHVGPGPLTAQEDRQRSGPRGVARLGRLRPACRDSTTLQLAPFHSKGAPCGSPDHAAAAAPWQRTNFRRRPQPVNRSGHLGEQARSAPQSRRPKARASDTFQVF